MTSTDYLNSFPFASKLLTSHCESSINSKNSPHSLVPGVTLRPSLPILDQSYLNTGREHMQVYRIADNTPTQHSPHFLTKHWDPEHTTINRRRQMWALISCLISWIFRRWTPTKLQLIKDDQWRQDTPELNSKGWECLNTCHFSAFMFLVHLQISQKTFFLFQEEQVNLIPFGIMLWILFRHTVCSINIQGGRMLNGDQKQPY